MPPKKSNIGPKTRKAAGMATARSVESDQQHSQRNELDRIRHSQRRENATVDQRQQRIETMRQERANVTDGNRQINVQRVQTNRRNVASTFYRDAFEYNNEIDYHSHNLIAIGQMDKICPHCKAKKFKNESPGMCCSNGKIKLPDLNTPPEPLLTLVSGTPIGFKNIFCIYFL